MYRILNLDAIPRIIEGVHQAEKVLKERPELAEYFAHRASFKGISQQIDAFTYPTGLVWYLKGYNTKINAPICESIPVNTKQYEYVKVRKDILDKLYAAVDEVTDMLHEGKDIAFGNVMEARDELECGKTYEDVGRNREIVTRSVIGEVHSMDEVYVINEVAKFHEET